MLVIREKIEYEKAFNKFKKTIDSIFPIEIETTKDLIVSFSKVLEERQPTQFEQKFLRDPEIKQVMDAKKNLERKTYLNFDPIKNIIRKFSFF